MSKKKIYLSVQMVQAIVVLLLVANAAFAQVSDIYKYPGGKELNGFFAVITKWGSDSVFVLRQADSLIKFAQERDDRKLQWYAEVFQFNYRQSLIKDTVKRKLFLASNELKYSKCPFEVVQGTFFFFSGNAYFNMLDFETAFRYLLRARDIFEKTGYENIPESAYYLSTFFGCYYYFEDYKQAAYYASLADKYANKDFMNPVFNLNNLGLAYLKMKEFAKAENTFIKGLLAAKATGDDVYTGILSGNYGNTLRLQGKYEQALPYLYTDVANNKTTEPSNTAISCIYLANCLLHLDSISKARDYINYSKTLQPNWVWSSYGVNYYETQALYYRKTDNYKTASIYQDSLTELKDSLRMIFSNKLLTATELTTNAEKYLTDKKAIELKSSNAKTIRNFIIIFLCLLSLSVILIIDQRRKKETLLQRQKQQMADEQLAKANLQLANYIENIREKNSLIERITDELAVKNKGSETESPDMSLQLQNLQQSVILTENDWVAFKKLFDQVWPDFFEQLLYKYPDLSPAELRLLALLKLDVSSKDMANMLGISQESLRKSRYRLRKKYPEILLLGNA